MTRKTMDFFGSQERARKKTFLLILLFILAVLFIIASIYAMVTFFLAMGDKQVASAEIWQLETLMWVALGVMGIIFLGSAWKIFFLLREDQSVAEMLGGIPVDPGSDDSDERRLLNVVEEMAIAAGIPVPRVYLLPDEAGINAFAAGLTPQSAVITVTKGCLKELSRDELQAVVAHEFSHILNGDMNLNVRLIGMLAGILIVGMTGKTLVWGSGKMALKFLKLGITFFLCLPLFFFVTIPGLVIMAIGAIGVFFAKLIKSAVSRQREFLADAAAVQFTRNPSGLIGALKKIASHQSGSRIRNVHAEEASHLFFGNGLRPSVLTFWQTHPPIQERIRSIDSKSAAFDLPADKEKIDIQDAPRPENPSLVLAPPAPSEKAAGIRMTPTELTSLVGNPQAEHLKFASQILSDLPETITRALKAPSSSRSVIYCLLLNKEESIRTRQRQRLHRENDPVVSKELALFEPVVDAIGPALRLPIVLIAIPALKLLSSPQYEQFRKTVYDLIAADGQSNLFEYALQRILVRRLDPVFKKTRPPEIKYSAMDQVQTECFALLSLLASRGHAAHDAAETAFRRGIAKLGVAAKTVDFAGAKFDLNDLNNALEKLALTSPRIKKTVLQACLTCISADSMITVDEADMLRAIADSLDCPIPPLLPSEGQVVKSPSKAGFVCETQDPPQTTASKTSEEILAKPITLRYEAYLGERNRDYYLARFQEFDRQTSGLKPSWNWAAFFGGGLWALYKKMYGYFFASCGIVLLYKFSYISFTALIVLWSGLTVFANAVYYRVIKKKMAAAGKGPEEDSIH